MPPEPKPVDTLERLEWGLFKDFSHKGPKGSPDLAKANVELKQAWKQNGFILKHIAGKKGILEAGVVMDAHLELEAEGDLLGQAVGPGMRRIEDTDALSRSIDDLRERQNRLHDKQWAEPGWRAEREHVQKDITQHKENVTRMEGRLTSLHTEMAKISETDARTKVERDAGEPPHPPYSRMGEIKEETKRLQEDVALEKRLLQAREGDAQKLEQHYKQEQDRRQQAITDALKKAVKHDRPQPPAKQE